MKTIKFLLLALITVTCLMLTGCQSTDSGIEIGTDGSAKLYMNVVGIADRQPAIARLRAQLMAQKDPEGKIEEYVENHPYLGPLHGFKYAQDFNSLKAMVERNNDLYQVFAPVSGSLKIDTGWFYDNYTIRLGTPGNVHTPDPMSVHTPMTETNPVSIFTLKIPYAVGDNNADEVSVDKKTLKWNLSPNIGNSSVAEMQATFKLYNRFGIAMTVLLAVGLGILAFILFIGRRQVGGTALGISLAAGIAALLLVLTALACLRAPVMGAGITVTEQNISDGKSMQRLLGDNQRNSSPTPAKTMSNDKLEQTPIKYVECIYFDVDMYVTPETQAPIIAKFAEPARVEVLGKIHSGMNEMYKVKSPYGITGYVRSMYFVPCEGIKAESSEVKVKRGLVKGSNVNVRDDASIGGRVIGIVNTNDVLEITDIVQGIGAPEGKLNKDFIAQRAMTHMGLRETLKKGTRLVLQGNGKSNFGSNIRQYAYYRGWSKGMGGVFVPSSLIDTGKSNTWYEIKLKSGEKGYIFEQFVELQP